MKLENRNSEDELDDIYYVIQLKTKRIGNTGVQRMRRSANSFVALEIQRDEWIEDFTSKKLKGLTDLEIQRIKSESFFLLC